jgi:DNA polymerase (family X)
MPSPRGARYVGSGGCDNLAAMDNAAIASALNEVADLLEIAGENPFRIRAYRNAVHTVEGETVPFRRRVEAGEDLTALPGIGKEMAAHIRELVADGRLSILDELGAKVPRSLLELMRLPNLGPKKAKRLWEELGITTVDGLEAAARAGQIAGLAGFGAKSQEKILAGIADYRQNVSRFRIDQAERAVLPLLERLRALPGVEQVEAAGSFRRRKESVGDLDLLAIATDSAPIMAAFTQAPEVASILGAGDTKASVRLASGLQVDLRVVPRESFGAALVYFTGSKEHNVRLRGRAVDQGLTVNEYGVFHLLPGDERAKGERVAGTTEAEVYASLGLPWIPPELREDHGELDAALAGRLPQRLEPSDLRGDLHMHSTWSDGQASIEEMVTACAARGYEYMVISDHSKVLAMARGLDAGRLREQAREIAEVQARHPEIRILKSQEVDILADGSLDLEDDALAELDIVLASVHSRFELPGEQQTRRILAAVAHPAVRVLCHPTGRLIGQRKPYDLDLEAVLGACLEHGVAIELNSAPERLDLKDSHLRLAKELGVPVVISTDAHSVRGLEQIRFGLDQARRAGLEPRHVLNTRPLPELLAWLGRRGRAC